MNASLLISSAVAGILSAFGVLIVIVHVCIAIGPRQVSQSEMRLIRENDLRVERADMAFQEMMQSDVGFEPMAFCVASVNPDGSIAVARELSAENKSAV